jgi:hypothetical protein
MDATLKTVTITVECLCKAHSISMEISTSKLPLQGNVCHCDSCRHSTGALCVIETTWPQPRESVDISGLQTYQFSADITYRFCGTCSTLMFYESRKHPSKLGVFSGPFKNIGTDVIKLAKHIFVGDTQDGGASVWLRKPNADGEEIPRYRGFDGESGEVPWSWPELSGPKAMEDQQELEYLPFWCHCKGINLRLHRGDFASRERKEIPWFIDPRNNKRLASFDVCDSCRLHFSNEVVNWTFTELADISQVDGASFPKSKAELKAAVDAGDPAVGTLSYYQSSLDADRYFCKVCSTAVFYICDDRPEIVDLAIGLLEAPDGARAQGYLSWTLGDSPVWINDTKGGWREGLAKRVQADAEEFRIAKGFRKSWRRLARESKQESSEATTEERK